MGWSPFRPLGLTHHDAARSCKGYTLLTPLDGKDTILIDMQGRVVHRWHIPDAKAGYGRLLDDGSLLLTCDLREKGKSPSSPKDFWALPLEERVWWIGGNYDTLRWYTWDGELTREHRDNMLHHDAKALANGNVLQTKWVELDQDFALQAMQLRCKLQLCSLVAG